MAPSETALVEGDGAKVQDVVKSLVIVTERTRGGGAYMHAFEGSQGGKTINTRTENERHEAFGKGVDVGIPCCVGLLKVEK